MNFIEINMRIHFDIDVDVWSSQGGKVKLFLLLLPFSTQMSFIVCVNEHNEVEFVRRLTCKFQFECHTFCSIITIIHYKYSKNVECCCQHTFFLSLFCVASSNFHLNFKFDISSV